MTDSISQIVSACPGEIGVAVIVNNRDTVKVNTFVKGGFADDERAEKIAKMTAPDLSEIP